nr:MAG TPA: HNH endonuclease [Caudoviricetes sp.]
MSGTRWKGRNRKQLRQLVTAVYGWTCTLCHRPIDPHATALRDRLSIDHVLPVSRGGTDAIENLRPAHYGCNAAKCDGSRTVRRRTTEIGIAFFPSGLAGEPAPTFHFPLNHLKSGKNPGKE